VTRARRCSGAQVFVRLGHRALWIAASADRVVGTPYRLGAFAVAGIVAWRLRGEPPAAALLAGYALVFMGRLLFEPAVFSYYLGPGLALLVVHEVMSRGSVRRTTLVGTLLLAYFSLTIHPVLWWLGAWTMFSVLVSSAMSEVFGAVWLGWPGHALEGFPLRGRASWRRWSEGSRWFPRTAASLERPDTTAPARARS
jgi:hypothetical protein